MQEVLRPEEFANPPLRRNDVLAGAAGDENEVRGEDVVLAVEGVQTTSMSSLVVALRTHRPGDVVSVTFVRGDAQHVAEVTLTDRA